MLALPTQRYLNVAQLRALLLGMERDLGLGDLSQNEKDVFYAVQSVIAGSDGVARSDDIKGHSLVFEMTQPTFHRSLKNLLDRGLLAHAPSTKAGSYVATEPENRQLEAVASI
ncbi:MAG: hypothetical protein HN582_04030 [Marinovum sp.]|nr:hypothetical protein [Marinovum sp.]MBT6507658.1 hypothetical protein [Marinovum sp.]MBT7906642.1 hypothetical protein [Marinovum sp.]